jgi:hypothetical protein
MPVSFSKMVNGYAAVPDDFTNAQTVTCPRCSQTYRLGYSDSQWNKVKDWLWIAETALRRDHAARHEASSIPLE